MNCSLLMQLHTKRMLNTIITKVVSHQSSLFCAVFSCWLIHEFCWLSRSMVSVLFILFSLIIFQVLKNSFVRKTQKRASLFLNYEKPVKHYHFYYLSISVFLLLFPIFDFRFYSYLATSSPLSPRSPYSIYVFSLHPLPVFSFDSSSSSGPGSDSGSDSGSRSSSSSGSGSSTSSGHCRASVSMCRCLERALICWLGTELGRTGDAG